MTFYFLSDLHLKSAADPASKRFLSFLKSVPKSGDTLLLGGDIFDLFVGNKKVFTEKFTDILQAMKSLERAGCAIYYLEGNHDFHLHSVFSGHKNIFIHADAFAVRTEKKSIWMAHGDQIDKQDYGYRLLRGATRSLPFRGFLRLTPDAALDGIGIWSSKKSRKYNSTERLDTATTARTRALFRDYALEKFQEGYDFVFLGHSHLEDHLRANVKGRECEYLNLGFSSETLLYASYATGEQALEIKQYSQV